MNEKITAKEVRLISVDGEQLGIVSKEEALERAQEDGLDLMEVSPNADPPVCRILNFGKLKYEEKKKIQINKKKQHVIKLKEIRLRPRIEDHDLITLIFRGRELSRIDLGKDVMDRVIEELSEVAEVEKDIPLEGRRMSVVLSAK